MRGLDVIVKNRRIRNHVVRFPVEATGRPTLCSEHRVYGPTCKALSWRRPIVAHANVQSHQQTRSGEERRQGTWTWVVPLGILAGLVGLYFVWPDFQSFINKAYNVLASGEQQRVEAWVSSFGAWGFAAILALMLLQTVLAFLPSLLPMVVSVLSYGPVMGGVLAWAGLQVAACLGYGIGRSVGPVTVDRLIGSEAERKVERFVDRYGVWAIVAARISPVLSTDAVSIVAGLVKMSFLRFIVATAVGTLPLAVAVAWLGADISRLKTGLIVISAASLAIFIGYVVYDRRTHERREDDA